VTGEAIPIARRFCPTPSAIGDDAGLMRRSDSRTVLTDEVARFQAEVHQLAVDAVRAIIQQELDRRQATLPRSPRASPGAAAPAPRSPRRQRSSAQATLPLPGLEPPSVNASGPTSADAALEGSAPSGAAAHATAVGSAASPTAGDRKLGGGKRKAWTREAIVEELATWMLSGTSIDATFVTRHGPPGLVAATRRVFGRFDAALNVAALHVSKLYPDGPPER
jgi:hypothetical protein